MNSMLEKIDFIYITNQPEIALSAERYGVSYIMVDMEYIGKEERQKGYDSVKNRHSFEDIRRIRKCLITSKLLVRCNPIHDESLVYSSSEKEIGEIIECGADIIMLPYFKRLEEVKRFLRIIDNKSVEKWLLLETRQAVEQIDEILELDGIDAIHIGLNDLSLGYHKKFMFELLMDGTVEALCDKLKKKGIPFGFGGVAALGQGAVPAEYILGEHYRLGSNRAILSRTFCNYEKVKEISRIDSIFASELEKIRKFEAELQKKDARWFEENRKALEEKVRKVIG